MVAASPNGHFLAADQFSEKGAGVERMATSSRNIRILLVRLGTPLLYS